MYVAINVNASTDLHTAAQFRNIIIKSHAGNLVRLGDIAKVELGSENYDSSVIFNGKKAVFMSISATPSANPLTVIDRVRKVLPGVKKDFPSALKGHIVYDGTTYIRDSVNEVILTIF